ncbi:MAG TPA: YihY/virulence factor BrkB family protein [Solirubrobacterales bacterium]|jgi:membrane protein|nr:YihY/virulence factor BrkB family protein [Solirubrobacterales bacterium]
MEPAGGGEGSALDRVRARAGHALGRAAKLTERAIDAFFKQRCSQLAASISYYALLSLFPSAIVAAAVFGIVIGDDKARAEVVDFLFDTLPLSEDEGRRDLERAVDGVTRNTEALGLVGLVGLLYSASALMGAVRNSLAIIWGGERQRPALRAKALDIVLVVGLGLLSGLSLAVTVLRSLAVDLGHDLGIPGRVLDGALGASGFLIPLALSAIVFAVLFRFVPYPRPRLRDVWPGIVVATIGYELAKRGFALYIDNFGNYSAVYGSLGAVIVFLVFIYIVAIVFLLGAEYAALWPRVRAGEFDDGPGKPLREEIRGFLRGLVLEPRPDREEEERS